FVCKPSVRLQTVSSFANRQFVCKPSVRLQTVSSFANRQFVCKLSVRLQTVNSFANRENAAVAAGQRASWSCTVTLGAEPIRRADALCFSPSSRFLCRPHRDRAPPGLCPVALEERHA